MSIRWSTEEEVDIARNVVEDWKCSLTVNFEDLPSNMNPIERAITCKRFHHQPIKKVIFSNPATIVFWNDGSKTVVKCSERDEYDPEKGLAMAIAKKFLGNKGNYYNTFTKYIPELRDEHDSSEVVSR